MNHQIPEQLLSANMEHLIYHFPPLGPNSFWSYAQEARWGPASDAASIHWCCQLFVLPPDQTFKKYPLPVFQT